MIKIPLQTLTHVQISFEEPVTGALDHPWTWVSSLKIPVKGVCSFTSKSGKIVLQNRATRLATRMCGSPVWTTWSHTTMPLWNLRFFLFSHSLRPSILPATRLCPMYVDFAIFTWPKFVTPPNHTVMYPLHIV